MRNRRRERQRPSDIFEVIRRHEAAIDAFKVVEHYADRAVMGRSMTDSEHQTYTSRLLAMNEALDSIAHYVCRDMGTLKTKAAYLYNWCETNALTTNQMAIVMRSIINMPRAAAEARDSSDAA